MIKLLLKEYCQSCPDFEAEITKETQVVDEGNAFLFDVDPKCVTTTTTTTIRCKHSFKCDQIEWYLRKEKKND